MSEGITRLKELLLDKEQRTIGDLSHRVDVLFDRAGSSDRLRQSVAEVLAGAIRDAEGEKDGHADLAAAVSPVIIETVRREIRSSSDEIAESLHPHMGRMISAYVANAIKDMMEKLNRRLESGLSPRRWVIKVRSMLTGASEAELLLADMNALRVEDVYLIRRGSGELMGHWEAPHGGDGAARAGGIPATRISNQDTVVSAFLTAITDFAREAFAATDGGLQSLDMQSHRVYMRSSPMYLLAVKCSGVPTPQTERLLDEAFTTTIERYRALLSAKPNGHTSPNTQALLPDLAARVQGGIDTEAVSGRGGGPNLAKWLLSVLALVIVGWLAWDKWITWQTERTRAAVDGVVSASTMGSYIAGVEVERGGAGVRLRGLSPSDADKDALLQAVRRTVAGVRIEDRIEVIPERGDGGVQSFKRDYLEATAGAALSATRRALQRARYRLQQVEGEIGRLGRDLDDAAARAVLETTARRLTAVRPDLDDIAGMLAKAGPQDDLAPILPRLEQLLSALQGASGALAEVRGEKAPQLARALQSADKHTRARDDAETLAAAVDGLWSELAQTERSVLRSALAKMAFKPGPSPQEQLVRWVQSHAIFFSNEATYREPAETERHLDELAALLARTGTVLRVVGYTDDLGTAARNSGISTDRAAKVRQALLDRGVSANRLVAVGRPNGPNLSATTGLNSPNRRVEFEVAFEQERNGG